ncbi:hypothetical protein BJ878DRAFT_545062 [Calycina marina]|uniref:Xylanolytic transcriptional activator regulatory domain-containing protein n=1 Tax=Calycina marina TaxID=1763456 RepID=A0A9P8CDT3_9HELO|nr:hypothetical protein BJ878DRAFT_545062 [Calycina marina]
MELTEVDTTTSTAESPSSSKQRDAAKTTDRVVANSASSIHAAVSNLESNKLDPLSFASVPSVAEKESSSSLEFPLLTVNADSDDFYSRLFQPKNYEQCIEGFFQYFYNAHPFLLPRHQHLQIFETNPANHLRVAMCYVGSRYVYGSSQSSFALEFESYLRSESAALKDASMVQAMLLFALGLDGDNNQTRAVEILIKTQSLAVELGMNEREYAVLNGRGSAICEESLRRTWWELYVVSIMMAGFHGRGIFQLRIMSTVPLPCEAKYFASGDIPKLHTMEDFEDDSFTGVEIAWSSYTYKIAAASILERILLSKQIIFTDDPALYRLETHIANWHLQLPQNKRDFIDSFGSFDEILFQAHMISYVSSILLHRRFSALENIAVQTITSCTELPQVALGLTSDHVHTAKAAQAASNISKLVILPGSLLKHTHFFVCAVTLSTISHLSLWSSLPVMAPDQDLRQQIQMNAGALKAVAHIFPSARMGHQQATLVAQKIHANRKNAIGEFFWRDFADEDFMTGLMENASTADS